MNKKSFLQVVVFLSGVASSLSKCKAGKKHRNFKVQHDQT